MKVLGIDPGYGRCGMAVVEKTPRGEILLYSNCVETDAAADFTQRLSQIVGECARLLQEYAPDSCAIEKLYFTSNQKTAMRVAEVRGALISCATEYRAAVFEYTPGEVKSAVTGDGTADKKQVATMIPLLLTLNKKIRYDDEFDAIAIALTHLARARMHPQTHQNAIQ